MTIDGDGMVLQIFTKSLDRDCERPRADRRRHAGSPAADTTRRTTGPGGRCRGRPPSAWVPWARASRHAAAASASSWRSPASPPTGPATGSGRPDFEHAAGAFVPEVRVLYGMAFPVKDGATMVRFESTGRARRSPGRPPEQACPGLRSNARGASTVGVVLAGETAGLVGAALRRSPVGMPAGLDVFAHTRGPGLALAHVGARARPQHGAGRRRRDPGVESRRWRRSSGRSRATGRPAVQGHFHAAVVPYRPLPAGIVRAWRRRSTPVRAGPGRDDVAPARRLAADRRRRREHVHARGLLVRPSGRRRGGESP